MTTRQTLPLIAGYHPQAVLAWSRQGPVTQGRFAADALALAQALPAGRYAINLCEDRYRFMLALAAVCLRGQTNLLPASGAAAASAALMQRYPQSYVLDDGAVQPAGGPAPTRVPEIAADHVAAIVFTSGSTGAPQPHAKRWLELADTARLARGVFLPGGDAVNIVATVPPQHMYGLETTVFFALSAGCATASGKPFFPADVRDALAAVPEPRLLITTPIHLRALLASGAPLPAIRLIISATAPLTAELAAQAEAAWQVPVREIYGCTEAGSVASRRTCEGAQWQLHPDMRIVAREGVVSVQGAHLGEAIILNDRIEIDDERHFRLLGRNADLLKVAGKRASLADLTQRLLAIPGVVDAAVFLPDGGERPAALVVAPDLRVPQVLAALAAQIDPVFLPRPLCRVAQLPRDALGKVSREQLQALIGKAHE
ncbi:MAG TPA: AMP-binding protein [Stenotrophobium sp.]|jgi:acyl-coenzyme A synthetase/AMP-(fatty) acid ligase|nr:AMP-binding protein [Stenotrophobium sp.]